MRAKKMLTYITGGCALISAVLAFVIGKPSNCIWYDYSMAIFGSALLGLIMSITEYFVERRRAMETFLRASRKVLSKLRKIEYFKTDTSIDNILDCFVNEQFNEYEMKKYRREFNEAIESCRAIADIDLGELSDAYGNLDFFFNGKIRGDLAYSKIYNRLSEYVEWVYRENFHFQLLKDGGGNFAVCAKKAVNICNALFEVREYAEDGGVIKRVFRQVVDDIADALDVFWCKTYYKTQEKPLEHNLVCEIRNISSYDAENSQE